MKVVRDLTINEVLYPCAGYVILKLIDKDPLPEILPGQFVEVRIDHTPSVFLRRPISVNFVDKSSNELWLNVHGIGDGTKYLEQLKKGDLVNCVFPLGKGFSMPEKQNSKCLLVGGGVGTAPLLYLGALLKEAGHEVTYLLGGKRENDILQKEDFRKTGTLLMTTEDGSCGVKGFVTNHPVLDEVKFDYIASCGPRPMMNAVAKYAMQHNIFCEVSLENLMACGLGACLCCVEKTTTGNRCVCKDGPVFNIKELTWQTSK